MLFPKEIIDNTIEVHRFSHKKTGRYIYMTVVLSLITLLISLPLIDVPIYTTSRGMLKPATERVAIHSVHSGKILQVNIKDNQLVQKGDTLLILNAEGLDKKLKNYQKKIDEIEVFITDCEYLSQSSNPKLNKITSTHYQKEFLTYLEKIKELTTRYSGAKQSWQRNKNLHAKKVIAKVEYENSLFDYKIAKSALKNHKTQQRKNWQVEITGYKNTLIDLQNTVAELDQHREALVITSPVEGVLKNVQGLQPNSVIVTGHPIAEISPDTQMIAECYFPPSDIGWIKKNDPVNFQIDAFHYNQWGLASGYVSDISKDVDMQNNQPVFKVRCVLDQKYLSLSNGFKGELVKGMTFSARFPVAERSLFDLLYDKADDWLNPSSPTIAQK